MNDQLNDRLNRLLDLKAQRDQIDAEIAALLGLSGNEAEPAPARKPRKPRGGGRKRKAAPEPAKPAARTYATRSCCGSKGPRHKSGCKGGLQRTDRTPEEVELEDKTWKCVECDARYTQPEQPDECENCSGTVFVEKHGWED